MKIIWLIFLWSLAIIGCSESIKKDVSKNKKIVLTSIEIPAISIDKSKLKYTAKNSLWTLDGKPFSGYAISHYPDGIIKQKFGIFNGKKQNQSEDWYTNGQLKQLTNYRQGKLHGEKKFWSAGPPPILIAHLNYHLGKAHGVQKKWYATGEVYKILNMNMGQEEGIQQAYRKNGNLYANYEAKAGRIFGLKKAALCYDLENEKIQYGK